MDPELTAGEVDVLRARLFALHTLTGLKGVKDGPLLALMTLIITPSTHFQHHETSDRPKQYSAGCEAGFELVKEKKKRSKAFVCCITHLNKVR